MEFLALVSASPAAGVGAWPFVVLAISVVFIVLAIAVFRLHAFLALILAALIAGWLTPVGSLPGEAKTSHMTCAVDIVTQEFGKAAGNIGVVIALAALIGMCLMESGAADKIVRRFIAFFGEERAALALLVSGFFLSIPVFFDTVFFLLIPLARAMSLRSKKDYMLYVMAIAGGGVITHSIVPPTPGPLFVGSKLNLDLGVAIVTGLAAGILPAIGALYFAKWINRRYPIPLREAAGASLSDLDQIVQKKEEELPAFGWSILPVVLPVVLIAAASFLGVVGEHFPKVVAALGGPSVFAEVLRWADFLGNKTFALLVGTLIAMWVYWRQAGLSFEALGEKLGPPLLTAGVIILITSAGGSFGAMIRYAGVGEAIRALAARHALNLIFLAWIVTVVIRVAQGSATVAMVAGVGLMGAVIQSGAALPFHRLYLYLAIGFGSMFFSWMNDSGFWVVGKLSGFNEKETLKSWSPLVTVISVIGLVETLICARLFPLK